MRKNIKTKPRHETLVNRQRIQKYLGSVGTGSRRGIELLLRDGRIEVNGKVAHIGDRVSEGDSISVDGGRSRRVKLRPVPRRVLAYNKPIGTICSKRNSAELENVYRGLPKEKGFRWVSVGRLDVNTSGLLLFTNNGDLASRLMHPSYQVDREYAVRVYGGVDNLCIKRLLSGVEIEGEHYRFADIVKGRGEGANHWYTCVVQAGRNREVRRTWESQGVQVSRLKRVRFGNILLPVDLRPGRHVELGEPLVKELCELVSLKNSDD